VGALLAASPFKRRPCTLFRLTAINPSFQAAKFGRGFLDLHNPTDFVNMGQTLKVLNAVRFFEIGIPLTHLQSVITLLATLNTHSLG
jgi:hypothetical protein